MEMAPNRPGVKKSALLIVDMQNDFLHRDGSFGHKEPANIPEDKIDIPFLTGTIPHVNTAERRLSGSRKTGRVYRPCA